MFDLIIIGVWKATLTKTNAKREFENTRIQIEKFTDELKKLEGK